MMTQKDNRKTVYIFKLWATLEGVKSRFGEVKTKKAKGIHRYFMDMKVNPSGKPIVIGLPSKQADFEGMQSFYKIFRQ
ncbi:hypothetical protein ACOSP7_005081 [Xanthoceras sorbifolium]